MTNRSKAILGITAIFLLGGVCGALLFGLIIRSDVRERQGLRDHDRFIDHFEQRLQLTEAQRDSLRDELEFAYNRLAELRRATSEQYNAVIDTLTTRIYPQLTPEQRDLFRQQEQTLRRMLPKERLARGGRGGGMPPARGTLPAPASTPLQQTPSTPSPAQNTPPKEPPAARTDAPTGERGQVSPQGPSSQATRNQSAEEREGVTVGENLLRLKGMLDLSSDQVTEINAIIADTKARNAKARQDLAENPGMRHMEIRRNNQELRRRVIGLLTEQQRLKFEEVRAARNAGKRR